MKERPIIFSTPMVRAILEGRKTQTRRAIKPQPIWIENSGRWWWQKNNAVSASREWWEYMGTLKLCPYGTVGDRLWVREMWIANGLGEIYYKADRYDFPLAHNRWKTPIYMPRWASRITLENTNIRVERLQDITEEEALEEGMVKFANGTFGVIKGSWNTARQAFGSYISMDIMRDEDFWGENPWVWVIEFRRLEK